ncbi:hypothetical protein KIM67_17850 [Flagellimonas sp. 389]|uniref:hypothetical protein n=1 Tax=Flagellimonas sp. 389 TaxID=2835862 RepID=UPI001BD3680A|nr:hypothetical protein [Flagellimonas sp. 389]MBS9464292.1 hypothetical protein [Flagellimonas sp. 389]
MKKSIILFSLLIMSLLTVINCRETKEEKAEDAIEEVEDGLEEAGEEVEDAAKDVKEELDGETDDH